MIFNKVARAIQWRRDNLLIKWCWNNWRAIFSKWKQKQNKKSIWLLLQIIDKNYFLKSNSYLNLKPKLQDFPGKTWKKFFVILDLSKVFSKYEANADSKRTHQLVEWGQNSDIFLFKIQLWKWKDRPWGERKHYRAYILQRFFSRISEDFLQLSSLKSHKKWAKHWTHSSPKKIHGEKISIWKHAQYY